MNQLSGSILTGASSTNITTSTSGTNWTTTVSPNMFTNYVYNQPPAAISFKITDNFSIEFDKGDKSVRLEFEPKEMMRLVYMFTKMLDKNKVKYKIKTKKYT